MFNDDIVDSVSNIEDEILDDRLINLDCVSDTLDQDITQVEVQDAIRALKNNKAPGPDGLCGELYKYSAPFVEFFLTKYFNKPFQSGTFPLRWSESVIQTLHKKGDNNSADNN